jgi:hypothetical protein
MDDALIERGEVIGSSSIRRSRDWLLYRANRATILVSAL